ncbi:MAG: hypothetical protein K5799_00185 [Erythrobacter sp.]|nr:hypothetical protein [Erythrobacter sp.]
MTKALIILAAASLSLTGLSVSPARAQDKAQQSEEKTEAAKDEVICKRYAPTGSRVKKKYCARASEWARSEAAALKFRTDLQDTVNSEGGGN